MVKIPKSPPAPSLKPIAHTPLVANRGVNVVAVGAKPVGEGAARLPSAINVPVNGTAPVAKDVVDAELITVFVKLSPEPPLPLTRFNTWLFGDFKKIVKSLSQVCVILNNTLTPVALAVAGIPATVRLLAIPAGVLSAVQAMVTFAGQVITGGTKSTTVIV